MNPAVLFDFLWPRTCEACGQPAGEAGRHLCWDCQAALPTITLPFCSCCGDPVSGAITQGYVCSPCVDHVPAFDLARSAIRFRGAAQDLLHRFKYSAATHLVDDLARLLDACVAAHYGRESFDAVTHVPLHPVKERSRTYNQAHLLASRLGRLRHLPLAAGVLERVRPTATQTRLNTRQRARNVAGAFAALCPAWIEGRSFLLVDDVMTTGATVNEAARTLKAAGARRVCVVTVARG